MLATLKAAILPEFPYLPSLPVFMQRKLNTINPFLRTDGKSTASLC